MDLTTKTFPDYVSFSYNNNVSYGTLQSYNITSFGNSNSITCQAWYSATTAEYTISAFDTATTNPNIEYYTPMCVITGWEITSVSINSTNTNYAATIYRTERNNYNGGSISAEGDYEYTLSSLTSTYSYSSKSDISSSYDTSSNTDGSLAAVKYLTKGTLPLYRTVSQSSYTYAFPDGVQIFTSWITATSWSVGELDSENTTATSYNFEYTSEYTCKASQETTSSILSISTRNYSWENDERLISASGYNVSLSCSSYVSNTITYQKILNSSTSFYAGDTLIETSSTSYTKKCISYNTETYTYTSTDVYSTEQTLQSYDGTNYNTYTVANGMSIASKTYSVISSTSSTESYTETSVLEKLDGIYYTTQTDENYDITIADYTKATYYIDVSSTEPIETTDPEYVESLGTVLLSTYHIESQNETTSSSTSSSSRSVSFETAKCTTVLTTLTSSLSSTNYTMTSTHITSYTQEGEFVSFTYKDKIHYTTYETVETDFYYITSSITENSSTTLIDSSSMTSNASTLNFETSSNSSTGYISSYSNTSVLVKSITNGKYVNSDYLKKQFNNYGTYYYDNTLVPYVNEVSCNLTNSITSYVSNLQAKIDEISMITSNFTSYMTF